MVTLMDRLLKAFSLLIFAAILVYIPCKILSFGWAPDYGMIITSVITKFDNLPLTKEVIVNSINSQIPLYYKAVEDNLFNLVVYSFILFNVLGLCFANKNHMAWFTAMATLFLADDTFIKNLLSCSPLFALTLLLMLIITLFKSYTIRNPKIAFVSILSYIFWLRIMVPPEITSLNIMNYDYEDFWNCAIPLPLFRATLASNLWILFATATIAILSYKTNGRAIKQFNNAYLASALVLQLFINLGHMDLELFKELMVLVWFSEAYTSIIDLSYCFKELRVKYLLSLFVICLFTFLATHDNLGKFSKEAILRYPVDFSMKELETWTPGSGGVFYSDNVKFGIETYYLNPHKEYVFIYNNNHSLFNHEKKNIINIQGMLAQDRIPLPEYYESWVSQMKPEDRLVTSAKINGLEDIEWLQVRKTTWIGRKKK